MSKKSLYDLKSFFRGKKVLITGGVGLIGSNLALMLAEWGSEVILIDSLIPEYGGNLKNIAGFESRLKLNIADVRDEHGMAYLVQDQDFLFNLAGQTSHLDSMLDPYTDLEINCRSQLSILEACRKKNSKIKIVYASTRQIYGIPDYLPVDEKHPLHPTDVNGINKMAGEWYHILYNNVYGIRSCALRLTNTYGPRMRIKDARQTFLGWWIRRLLEGKEIEVFGDGNQIRDFNYVDDVVEAMILAAFHEEANGRIFNLGDSNPISLKCLAELLIKIQKGGSYQLVSFPEERKAIDIGNYYSDFSLVRNVLGWEPKVNLENGLCRTLEYFRENLSFYL